MSCPRYQRCAGRLDATRRHGPHTATLPRIHRSRTDATTVARPAFLRALSGPDAGPERQGRPGGEVRLPADRQALPVGRRRATYVRLLRSGDGRLAEGRTPATAPRRPSAPRDP